MGNDEYPTMGTKFVKELNRKTDKVIPVSCYKGYYQILEDTLTAIKLEPYLKSVRKRLTTHPKYYLFDRRNRNELHRSRI
jgi:predicted AAA+ superfamily ATPase